MTFNLVGNFTISRDIFMSKSRKGNDFCDAMDEFMGWNGKPNLVDSFPFLKWFDPQGIRKNTENALKKLRIIVAEFVKERIQENNFGKGKTNKDFLDALLEHVGDGTSYDLSEENLASLLLEMFLGGIDTTSSTLHWGLTELVRHPKSLMKLQDEIDKVTGSSRKVEESDINNLPYLKAVVKETMRLHPSFPLLLPRKATRDTEFMGYFIPKNTVTILNVSAIHKDPDSWDDPLSFRPERFINSNIDLKGQHFELIPFGSGRRSCIGMLLGEKMVSLTLAKMVQSFDWKLPTNESADTMDMEERMGIILRKLVPLKVIPIERKS